VNFQPVESNLRESFRILAAGRPGGDVRETPGLSIASAGAAFQMFNAAFLSGPGSAPISELQRRIALASVHFRARGIQWAFWVCDDLVEPKARKHLASAFERHGLYRTVELPGMAAARLLPPRRALPVLEIRRVCDEMTRLAFCDVGSTCFNVPIHWFREIFLWDPVWKGFQGWVGYFNGEPVATAAAVVACGVAGVYNVATLPTHRRLGCAEAVMRHALAIAARGIGRVEPNPAVGAVVVDDQLQLLGEGHHAEFGGPHAEVVALQQAGERARGATLFVTLEPCSHFGKTPPCAPAVVAAGIRKVFVAVQDPFPQVSGRGIAILKDAGIERDIGLCEVEARRLIAPCTKLTTTGLPYVHAKWAMTIDGRIATASGGSKWISGFRARALVHELRGRMDAVAVGIETALADDPLLTARPSGPRNATRIVFDSHCRLPLSSKLATSSSAIPVIVVARHDAPEDRINALSDDDVEREYELGAPLPQHSPAR